MDKIDEYRRNADYCRHMADSARTEGEKRAWRALAQSWLKMMRPWELIAAFDVQHAARRVVKLETRLREAEARRSASAPAARVTAERRKPGRKAASQAA
jgi:hypothetical protein